MSSGDRAAAAASPGSRSAGSTGPRGTRPRRPCVARSALVAAITRTSTLIVCVVADALELTLLQHAQQLHLQRHAHRAHFVEEQRAAMRLLEPSLPGADGAGERARARVRTSRPRAGSPGIALQLSATNRCAAPRARVMDRARDHFLARAGLAGDENRARRARDGLAASETDRASPGCVRRCPRSCSAAGAARAARRSRTSAGAARSRRRARAAARRTGTAWSRSRRRRA